MIEPMKLLERIRWLAQEVNLIDLQENWNGDLGRWIPNPGFEAVFVGASLPKVVHVDIFVNSYIVYIKSGRHVVPYFW